MDHLTYEYPKGHTYDPVGQCIYCTNRHEPHCLTREHIIPYGLNGTLVLPKASCPTCAAATAKIETFCLRRMFIDARTHLQLATRGRRRNRLSRPPLRVGHIGPDGEVAYWRELTSGQHPFGLLTADYAPPGILEGRNLDDTPLVEICFFPGPDYIRRFAALPPNASLHYIIDTNVYAQMIVKVAHSFAVANLGLDGFCYFLPKHILESYENILHYVGGTKDKNDFYGDRLHRLGLSVKNNLVIVRVQLFAIFNTPTYIIVAGEKR